MSGTRNIEHEKGRFGTGRITSMETYRRAKADALPSPANSQPEASAVVVSHTAWAWTACGERAFSNLDRWQGTLAIRGGGRQ